MTTPLWWVVMPWQLRYDELSCHDNSLLHACSTISKYNPEIRCRYTTSKYACIAFALRLLYDPEIQSHTFVCSSSVRRRTQRLGMRFAQVRVRNHGVIFKVRFNVFFWKHNGFNISKVKFNVGFEKNMVIIFKANFNVFLKTNMVFIFKIKWNVLFFGNYVFRQSWIRFFFWKACFFLILLFCKTWFFSFLRTLFFRRAVFLYLNLLFRFQRDAQI